MLTRSEALALIDEAEQLHTLPALAAFWIGHSEHDPENLAEMLRDYVDECCLSDNVRSNGPSDGDDTGLTAPSGADELLGLTAHPWLQYGADALQELRACLTDPGRYAESYGWVDDMQARCSMPAELAEMLHKSLKRMMFDAGLPAVPPCPPDYPEDCA